MSRIGKMPVEIPSGVEVKIDGQTVSVKGAKGRLERSVHADMRLELDGDRLLVHRPSEEQGHRALHGLTRALIANMVTGVTDGFERVLLIEGTGYRAEESGKDLVLNVGFSHPVTVKPLGQVTFTVEERGKKVTLHGIDKEAVGQTAVNIRSIRPPEPYKGKGIRYADEHVRRKAGKAGKVGA